MSTWGAGMPASIRLVAVAARVSDAFGATCYLVGSALQSKDWRDVDVRLILSDEEFERWFPGYDRVSQAHPTWSLLCDALSELARQMTGLPVDFQIQGQTEANAKYPGMRSALGLRFDLDYLRGVATGAEAAVEPADPDA